MTPAGSAAPTDRAAHWYDRLGGAGITKPLWECWRCGAAVSDRDKHNEWHRSVKR